MTEAEVAEMVRGAQSAGIDFPDDDTPEAYDPLYAVTRRVEGDVIVRWSEMTDAEREQAWRHYERAFGTPAEKESK